MVLWEVGEGSDYLGKMLPFSSPPSHWEKTLRHVSESLCTHIFINIAYPSIWTSRLWNNTVRHGIYSCSYINHIYCCGKALENLPLKTAVVILTQLLRLFAVTLHMHVFYRCVRLAIPWFAVGQGKAHSCGILHRLIFSYCNGFPN